MTDRSDSDRSRSRSLARESPKAERLGDTELRVRGLTRNVTAEHVKEIMGTFGPLERIEFAIDDAVHLPRGFADVSFKNEEDGRLAKEYMHEGQIDGARVTVIYRRNVGRVHARKMRTRSPIDRRRRPSSPYRRRSYNPPPYRNTSRGPRGYSSRSPVGRGRSRSQRRGRSISRSPYSSRSRSFSRSRSPRRSRSPSRSPYSSRSYSSRSYSSGSYSSRSRSRGRSPPRRR